jgi:hypothetical protein
MGRNLFELLLEQDRQASHDAAYFASAVSRDGRRFSEEFTLRKVALYVRTNMRFIESCFLHVRSHSLCFLSVLLRAFVFLSLVAKFLVPEWGVWLAAA